MGLIVANNGFSMLFMSMRILAGLLVVLFWPGYCLQAAVFPKQSDLDGRERIALSFGLSICLVAVMAPVLDRLPWGVRFWPAVIGYAVFILGCTGVGAYRRRNLPEADRHGGIKSMNVAAWWKRTDESMRKAYAVQALAVLGGVGVLIVNMIVLHPGEQYSEFYIVGSDGLAEGFIREVRVGQRVELLCGIGNYEGAAAEYQVEVRQQGELIGSGGPYGLQGGEVLEAVVEFAPARAGEDVKIEFWLSQHAEERPYRRLELWVDVME
jgi:uncharacterized membrane protein